MFIARPLQSYVNWNGGWTYQTCGLFLELKRDGTKIYRKDGSFVADQHILEQAHVMHDLRKAGYAAEFAVGLDEAKRIIEEYLR